MSLVPVRPDRRDGFTMIELVVTVVVVAVLASIAVVSYRRVTTSAHDGIAQATADSIIREASALAAFRQTGTWTDGDVLAAIADLPTAATLGIGALSGPATAVKSGPLDCSVENTELWSLNGLDDPYEATSCIAPAARGDLSTVSYAISSDGQWLGLAFRSESGNAVFARGQVTGDPQAMTHGNVPDEAVLGAVALVDNVFDSGWTMPDGPAVSAPTGLTATVSGATVHLAWDPGDGDVTGYRVLRNGVEIASVGSGSTTFDDSTGPANTEVTYTIVANSPGGDSAPSNGATITIGSTQQRNYASCGDTNGVLYQGGTRNGTVPFANPMTTGFANVSTNGGGATVHRISDRSHGSVYDGPASGGWVAIDLGADRRLVPNRYTITSASAMGGYSRSQLRNWALSGSNDGITWSPLDVRVNDTTMTGNGACFAFDITGIAAAFRHLRIESTGNHAFNSTGFMIGELELYGELRSAAPLTAPGGSQAKAFDSFSDTNGLFYDLGTRGGTEAFTSPAAAGRVTVRGNGAGTTGLTDRAALSSFGNGWDSSTVGTHVSFDLGPNRRMAPTFYSVQGFYGSVGADGRSLWRNWSVQGSNNGTDWTDLDTHTNDTTIAVANRWYGFWIVGAGSYRHLRINFPSSGASATEIEFYGVSTTTTTAVPPGSTLREFNAFGDTNGVFYGIGFNGTTYTNPAKSNRALAGTGPVTDLTPIASPNEVRVYTNGGNALGTTDRVAANSLGNGWDYSSANDGTLTWDFGADRTVRPTFYTIRGMYGSVNQDNRGRWRNWKLQGSNDGTTWTDLSVHTNDQYMVASSIWYGLYPNQNDNGSYRFLRITQTGPSAVVTGAAAAEVEFYGVVSPA